MTNQVSTQKCGKPGCENGRHITKSGTVRGYCRQHENSASLSSKAKMKMADKGAEVLCCEACLNSVIPVEECTCRCGGQYHGFNHQHPF